MSQCIASSALDASRGALTCLNNLEPFDQNDKITEGGRSQFPAPATGLTLDQSSCCAELGGRSPDDYLPSKASQVPGDDALGFRPPKLPPSRIACSPHTSPSLGTLKFSPDRFLCGDCPLRFSPVPDLSLVPTPRSCWLAPQQPVQSCGTGAFDNAVLRCPCLDTAPESGLHACLPGVIGGPDWPKESSISSLSQCIASSADPALMLASACQAGPHIKLQECASQATPFRVLGLLAEHFALQDDAPDAQATRKDAAVSQAVFDVSRGALTCPTYLEHFELNDTTIEDGRSHFPAPATGPTSDHFPCCDQLGGRTPFFRGLPIPCWGCPPV